MFDTDGSLTRSVPTDLLEIHSMTFGRVDGQLNL
jgi:hypothetical protein